MIIYKVTNKVNGKCYVGQTIQKLEKRIQGHLKESKMENNRPFLLSIKKYGIDNFLFEVIDTAKNLIELDDKEIYWIDKYNTISPHGYNITKGGQGKKIESTEELKKSISTGLKSSQKWQTTLNSEEYKRKMNENFFYSNKGKKFKQEHKEKIWLKNKDRVLEFNKKTSKKWIIVDKDNNILRLTGKEEFSNNFNLDSGNLSRMSKKLFHGKNVNRYNGYYCFIDNGETDELILNLVLDLDKYYAEEIIIYNKLTKESKFLKKNELYSFCEKENYDYSSFLRMTKGQFKSYRGWSL
jgi:group I intron endonuclease